MINISEKKDCCGCTACFNICPKKAISMYPDSEGFLYPVVNKNLCIDCGMCDKVCPYVTPKRPKTDLEITYAAVNKNDIQRASSSSGGMFVLFATEIINRGGIVYGAAYDDNWLVFHRGVDNLENLNELIGSKYMQSRLENVYSEIQNNLQHDRITLFVGTTCQVNGLKNYLKKDYDKLYCIDFICLGVPSPMIWKDYLNTYFDEEEIESINFKEKSLGWHMFSLNIKSKRKNFVKNGRKTYYYTGYFRHLYTRPSCSNCTYKIGNRCSDITISDCWGSQKIAPEMDDDKGMSSIVCHSKKGKQLFDEIKNQTKWKCADIEDILEFNSGYRKSVAESELRDCFWNDYRKLDKGKLFKKYCTPEKNDIFHRIARKIKRIMKK